MDVRTAAVEASYDWTFTRIYADDDIMDVGESFLVPDLPQGEICHDC
jgi:hypothetical protein